MLGYKECAPSNLHNCITLNIPCFLNLAIFSGERWFVHLKKQVSYCVLNFRGSFFRSWIFQDLLTNSAEISFWYISENELFFRTFKRSFPCFRAIFRDFPYHVKLFGRRLTDAIPARNIGKFWHFFGPKLRDFVNFECKSSLFRTNLFKFRSCKIVLYEQRVRNFAS